MQATVNQVKEAFGARRVVLTQERQKPVPLESPLGVTGRFLKLSDGDVPTRAAAPVGSSPIVPESTLVVTDPPMAPNACNNAKRTDSASLSLEPLPADKYIPVKTDGMRRPEQIWLPRSDIREVPRRSRWKAPLWMSVFFLLGVGLSITHCLFYYGLNGTVVGSAYNQESTLR
jgi:hypothetical protein